MAKISKAQLKARGRVVKVGIARSASVALGKDKAAPREKFRLLKGQVAGKARATIFAKQQREKRIRSIVDRKGRGRVEIPGRLKQFKGAREGAILQRVPVNSSWVSHVLLVMFNGQPALGVRFKAQRSRQATRGKRARNARGAVSIVYTKTNLSDFELMAAAGSKGKFIWRRLYHGIPGAGSPYRRI